MWTPLFLAGIGLGALGLGTAAWIARTRTTRHVEGLVAALLADATTPPDAPDRSAAAFAALPPPIRRYLRHVLPPGTPPVRRVRIEQSGTFRTAPDAAWRPFTATQHATTAPPGFVWDASIHVMPLLPVRVLDAYHDGRGELCARLGGLVTVAAPAPSPDLDEGELLRYLAEAPLYPTALLPGRGVTWTAIDDDSARATLTDGATTASLVFHVNERNEVDRVSGTRGFTHDDGTVEPRPWTGVWRRYRRHDGLRVPTAGEVGWGPPGAAASYWRGRMDRIEYAFGPTDPGPAPASGADAVTSSRPGAPHARP
jgi:hypothetical protein